METTEILDQALSEGARLWESAEGWLISPAAWSQFALLVVAYLLALVATKRLRPLATRLLTPAGAQDGPLARARRFVLIFVPLMLPLLAWVFTGIGESVTRSLFGSGAVIAFGKRVFLFLAVRILVREIIADPMMKVLGRYVLIPVAALYAVGLLDPAMQKLDETIVPLGNLSFSLMFAIRFLIVGGRYSGWAAGRMTSPRSSSRNRKTCARPCANWPPRRSRLPFSASPSCW